MASKRPPNPYTKYGRRRMRQEVSQEAKRQGEKWGCIITAIIIVVGFILAALFGGEDGVSSWIKYISR